MPVLQLTDSHLEQYPGGVAPERAAVEQVLVTTRRGVEVLDAAVRTLANTRPYSPDVVRTAGGVGVPHALRTLEFASPAVAVPATVVEAAAPVPPAQQTDPIALARDAVAAAHLNAPERPTYA